MAEELLDVGELGREAQAAIDVFICEEVPGLFQALVNRRLRMSFVCEWPLVKYYWRSWDVL